MRISRLLWGVLKNNSCYFNCPVVRNDPLPHSFLIDYSIVRLILYLSDIPHKSDCHCGKQLVDVRCNTCSVISLRQVLSCSRGSSRCDRLICDPQQHWLYMYWFCFLAYMHMYMISMYDRLICDPQQRRPYICIGFVSLLSDK